MNGVAVLMPSRITDDWRHRAYAYTVGWYCHQLPGAVLVLGTCSGPWSKGEAVAAAAANPDAAAADVLVIADADSFLAHPGDLHVAIELVAAGKAPWVVPHGHVYRLREAETARLYADPAAKPRLGATCRPVYHGPAGGGITVVSRDAFELVGGIDRRFQGWGGEDLAFGWALETLAGAGARLAGRLVHLWHPHPAPDLRGPPESEDLVACYRTARGVRRRMLAVLAGEPCPPAIPIERPVRFTAGNRTSVRFASGDIVRFRDRYYATTDPDEIEQLRAHTTVREVSTR